MTHTDIKLAILNILTFFISFSNIENALKIILLIFSIIYTGYKIRELHVKHKNNGSDNSTKD